MKALTVVQHCGRVEEEKGVKNSKKPGASSGGTKYHIRDQGKRRGKKKNLMSRSGRTHIIKTQTVYTGRKDSLRENEPRRDTGTIVKSFPEGGGGGQRR